MKKILCLLLCLMLPLTAMAAPVRDMRESVLSESELRTMREWLDKTVREALPVEYDGNTYVGAYVYSCVEDGGCYVLECDVYLEDGSDSLPEMAADEVLILLSDGAGEDVLLRTEWTAPVPSPGGLAAALVERGAEEGDDATVAVVQLRSSNAVT